MFNRVTFKKIKDEYTKWEFRRFLYICLMSAIKRWFTLYVVSIQQLNNSSTANALGPHRSMRIASKHELLEIARDPEYEISQAFIENALARGDVCAAIFENEKIITYVWRAFGGLPYDKKLWIEFKPLYRYEYKLFTHRSYRRQGLTQILGLWQDPETVRRGCTCGIIFIESHNFPSRLSDIKRGGKVVGYVGYFKVAGLTIPIGSKGAEKQGFRFRVIKQ